MGEERRNVVEIEYPKEGVNFVVDGDQHQA